MPANKVIYLLEDDSSIRELVEYILVQQGFVVHAFGTVKSFQQGLQDIPPHLFIMDIMLPDGNGIDISIELRSNPKTGDIPILLMSANYNSTDEQIPGSANQFLAKPFDIDDLLQKVHMLTA